MGRRIRPGSSWLAAAAAAALLTGPASLSADTFTEDLERVDEALAKNPHGVPQQALLSCQTRRNAAVQLYQIGEEARARRRLEFCWDALKISKAEPTRARSRAPTMEEVQANAAREVERALELTPNHEKGLAIFRECALCHMPEGWGLETGIVPQIAGQHRQVVIKQLADIRAGNRDNLVMMPYASVEAIGGVQAVADVAGYVSTLEISIATGKGPGDDLEHGEKLYRERCVECHGTTGEGDGERFIPRIQSQHFGYLVRQFEAIRDGKRRNASPDMRALVQDFDDRDTRAVMDYVSRLEPPPELQAPPGWHNPDFAK